MKNKKGFTLSEVLVVVALVSIILLIVIPSILLINRRINRRLLEGKKEVILTAAELYGNDNSNMFENANAELEITVGILLETGYIEADEKDTNNCDIETYRNGCVIDPMNKDENLNDTPIMIYKKNNTFTALWDETNSGQTSEKLLTLVCQKLKKEFEKEDNLTISIGEENSYTCSCEMQDGDINNLTLINANGEEVDNCYFTSDNPKNWLYYSEIDFRIMGIEQMTIENEETGETELEYYVKMITNDNI